MADKQKAGDCLKRPGNHGGRGSNSEKAVDKRSGSENHGGGSSTKVIVSEKADKTSGNHVTKSEKTRVNVQSPGTRVTKSEKTRVRIRSSANHAFNLEVVIGNADDLSIEVNGNADGLTIELEKVNQVTTYDKQVITFNKKG